MACETDDHTHHRHRRRRRRHSVIDLGWAEMVPLQFAAEYPRFLTPEPIETATGISWGGGEGDVQRSQDRRYYLSCVRDRAEREGGLALWYYWILSRSDE